MINHLRTLLVNTGYDEAAAFSEMGDQLIPATYKARKIPSALAGARVILFGAAPDRAMLNYRAWQLLQCIDAAGMGELAAHADKRVTYDIRSSQFYSREEFLPKVTPLGSAEDTDVVVLGELAPCDSNGKMRRTFTLSVDGSSNLTVTDNVFGTSTTTALSISGGFSQVVSLNNSGLSVKLKNVTSVAYDLVAYAKPTRSVHDLVTRLGGLSSANYEAVFANTASLGQEASLRNIWDKHPDPVVRLAAFTVALGYKTERLPNRITAVDTTVPAIEEPVALDIRASVGTSTSPTSTGTKAVTGVGFEPKVVIPFGVPNTSSGAVGTSLGGLGCSDGTNQAAISLGSANGITTSQTFRRHTNAKSFTWTVNSSTVGEEAALSSFDSDGFTLNWTTASATAYILNHIALGGADLEVSLTQHQMNGTNGDESFAHGLTGGAPTGVLFFSACISTAPPGTSATLYNSLGAWSSSSQFGAAIYSNNGVATTNTRRALFNNAVLPWTGPSMLRSMGVASVDATNVNVTYPVTTNSSQLQFWMLALRGAKCQTGTFDCNGSTTPLTIDCTGITPKLFMPVFVPDGVDSPNVVSTHGYFAMGASDGTNNVSCGITDRSSVTTTNARRFQSSTSFEEYSNLGIQQFEATASFDGESVVVTPTLNTNTSFGQGAYIIIGA